MAENVITVSPSSKSIADPSAIAQATPAPSNSGFLAQVSDNPFFTAGIGLAGLGVALSSAQKGLRHGAAFLKRRLLVDVEINVKDESYQWFLYWMTIHQRNQLSPSQLGNAKTSLTPDHGGILNSLFKRIVPRMHHLSISTEKLEHPNGAVQTRFVLIPGPGRHLMRYKGTFVLVNRVRETKSMDLQMGRPWETVSLTTLYSQRHIFQSLFAEAHELAERSTEGKTIVYMSRGTYWEKFGEPRRKRPLDSVILDKGVKEMVVKDVQDFLHSGKWYYDRGIPYRRGYLLHGPPGSGKSSFVQSLAGELDYSIAMLNLSERGLTDDRLNHLLSVIPKRCLVLLEDADAAFANRRTQTDADGYRGANVTFSGLLNALDGVASAEERLLFLTTNHLDRLDEALIRPGRVDLSVRLGEVTRWQAGELWDRFYGNMEGHATCKAEFLQTLEDSKVVESETASKHGSEHGVSAAALQGLFLHNKGDMRGAIDMAKMAIARPDAGPEAGKAV